MEAIIARFVKDESGATAIEYGLIAAIVGVGIVVGLDALKDGLNTLFTNSQHEAFEVIDQLRHAGDRRAARLYPPRALCRALTRASLGRLRAHRWSIRLHRRPKDDRGQSRAPPCPAARVPLRDGVRRRQRPADHDNPQQAVDRLVPRFPADRAGRRAVLAGHPEPHWRGLRDAALSDLACSRRVGLAAATPSCSRPRRCGSGSTR